ncbi:sensor histidine kinase [Yinghuangia sp. YIM S10712]|uniref:sensor histidine kinase n=1 Tax=Yinghuangia sp. YIM S10712 TaxID=3436930 RepID=UPI003F532C40
MYEVPDPQQPRSADDHRDARRPEPRQATRVSADPKTGGLGARAVVPAGSARSLPVRLLREPTRLRSLRELLYVTAAFLLTVVLLVVFVAGVAVAVPLSITVVGLPLLAGVVLLARYQGGIHRAMARMLLREDVPAPRPFRARPGAFGWLGSGLGHAEGWRGLAFLVVRVPIVAVGIAVAWWLWAVGAVCAAYPVLLAIFDPHQTDESGRVYDAGIVLGDNPMDSGLEILAIVLAGLVLLLAAPWGVRLVTRVDLRLMRALLGPIRLAERVRDLEETRALAVDDSAARLRRIERDLHDGAQARIVALAMHLSQAQEQLDPEDPGQSVDLGKARTHVDSALGNARIAIGELRDLARGIHPPVLDQGLDAALGTLVAGCAVPVRLHTDIARRPPAALETIAYFCAAELLTNATRHGGATEIAVTAIRRGDTLTVGVDDNGRGGARVRDGGGLAGLAERVRTVDGVLRVDSPVGGPTRVTVEIPVRTT